METVELKRIWKALAENKLIDKDLAKDNILQIITKKGNGIISKITGKNKFDLYVNLFGVILIPFTILFAAYYNNQHPLTNTDSELIRSYLILSLFEILMIYLLSNSIRNVKFLNYSYNTGSLRESLIKVKSYFDSYLKKGYWIGVIFMISMLTFILVDLFMKIGGIDQMNFSSTGPTAFASYFSIFVMILIIAVPFIMKIDSMRYAGVMRDLDQTIDELNEEE